MTVLVIIWALLCIVLATNSFMRWVVRKDAQKNRDLSSVKTYELSYFSSLCGRGGISISVNSTLTKTTMTIILNNPTGPVPKVGELFTFTGSLFTFEITSITLQPTDENSLEYAKLELVRI